MNLPSFAYTFEDMERIEQLLADRLQIDGAHHKQWYLEQIASILEFDMDDLGAEEGIAP